LYSIAQNPTLFSLQAAKTVADCIFRAPSTESGRPDYCALSLDCVEQREIANCQL